MYRQFTKNSYRSKSKYNNKTKIYNGRTYDSIKEATLAEELDWRKIDPKIHSWQKGLAEFKSIHSKIIEQLNSKDDELLKGIVDYRNYYLRMRIHTG